ncbi:Cytochrome P450 71A25 [Vitis vinifera]|uniref:Cytochrome P450 71A25 n=1 Tax=Vitis vinifera TaxID=29760 RepID=A0A438E8K0_VITVI|nr:Cytochrome P450 71A25 [Vitis vinifera]
MEAPSWVVLAMVWLAAAVLLSKLFSFWPPHKQNLPPGPKPGLIIRNLNLIGHLPHRPQTAAGKYTAYNYSNIIWAPFGPYWRQESKIYHTELFNWKKLESYEYIGVEGRWAFISHLYALSGKPVMLKDHLSRVTLGVISRIVLREKYSMSLNPGGIGYRGLHSWTCREDFVAKDMVDMLLRLVDDPDLEVKLGTDGVKGLTLDLIAGGTDSSATTMEWAMSEILRRRMCAGYRLGLKMIRSSLTNMLHGFHWKLPWDMKTEELNMEEGLCSGFTEVLA